MNRSSQLSEDRIAAAATVVEAPPAPLRLLLVDDNPADRALVNREIHKEFPSARIHEAIDQRQLDACLEGQVLDIVITDYKLQWSDGIRVLQQVKKALPACPVIMFTATGSEDVAVEAMKQGLDDYIIKNVRHLVRLRAAVRAALNHAAVRQRARQLESRLDSLLTQLTVGVFRREPDGTLLDVNDAAANILGLENAASAIGMRWSDFLVDPEEQARFLNKSSSNEPREFACRVRTRDGRARWISISERADPTAGSEVVEGLLEDVTEQYEADEALRRSQAELAHISRLSTMGELVAGIAHEVNQPLGAIANFAASCLQALERADPQPPQLKDWLHAINDQSHRAAEIVRNLRRFARNEEPSRIPLPARDLVDDTLLLVSHDLRHAKVVLRNLVPTSIVVWADRVQVQQMLVNLILNACDAMQDVETAERTLIIRAERRENQAVFLVEDRGTGLPQELADKLFQPFVTSKSHGMGMGLAVTARLVHAHGGTIQAKNNAEQGATVSFTLPLATTTERSLEMETER